MGDIYKYITGNYHLLLNENLNVYRIDIEKLEKTIFRVVLNLDIIEQVEKNDIPTFIIINSAERKSKYIIMNDEHYILLDLHQIIECAWALKVTRLIDEDILFVVSAGHGEKKEYNVDMSLFTYDSNENLLRAEISTCYNLADLCFSKGYVDAAVKNLCSIMMMKEDINSNGVIGEYSGELFNLSECVGTFVLLHEYMHYLIRKNKNVIGRIRKYSELLDLIRLKYENGILSEEWKKYAKQISSDNFIENKNIFELFAKLEIIQKYPKFLEELKENILSWKELTFNVDDWEAYGEELICDIEALNIMCGLWNSNANRNYYLISHIVQSLLIQETFSLQEDMLLYVTGKRKTLHSHNIKRAQLIFAALVVGYQDNNIQQEGVSIIDNLELNKNEFTDLMIDICNSVEVIHENFYLVAVQNFCKSLLSENVLHRHINCAYYLNNNYKDFAFTDDYHGRSKKYTGKSVTSIDAVFLQKSITHEYNKFVDYVFK